MAIDEILSRGYALLVVVPSRSRCVALDSVLTYAVQSAVRVRAKEHDHLGVCQIGGAPQLAAQSNYPS